LYAKIFIFLESAEGLYPSFASNNFVASSFPAAVPQDMDIDDFDGGAVRFEHSHHLQGEFDNSFFFCI
jgi:hypothetical protein